MHNIPEIQTHIIAYACMLAQFPIPWEYQGRIMDEMPAKKADLSP